MLCPIQPHALPISSSANQYHLLTFETWHKGVQQVQIVLNLCRESSHQVQGSFNSDWEVIHKVEVYHSYHREDLLHFQAKSNNKININLPVKCG